MNTDAYVAKRALSLIAEKLAEIRNRESAPFCAAGEWDMPTAVQYGRRQAVDELETWLKAELDRLQKT